MRRFPAILALLAVAAVASGAARYVHEAAHAHPGPAAHPPHGHHHHHAQPGHDGHDGQGPGEPVPHDESHCLIHALLKLPMLGSGFTPPLVCLGLFVALLALPPLPARARRPVLRLDCRGPPAAAA